MDPTTLVTFLFKAPPEVRTVELLGSWDNFDHAYRMHNDRRRGRGLWSGCFNFKDIIFDGDQAERIRPRTGGLKQGGTYWYFYRLNDAVEAFDDGKEFTQGCPLLPGQTVNVIDVPLELEEPPSRRRSATTDVVGTLAKWQHTHTLDPDQKWALLQPPPISRVHQRCISDMALSGRLETRPVSFRGERTPSRRLSAREGPQYGLAPTRQSSAPDSHSFRPRASWDPSTGSSRCDASIVNGYPRAPRSASTACLSAFPVPNINSPNARPVTRDGGSSCGGFDFDFGSRGSRCSRSRDRDDEFDGTSFILEPANSPPLSSYSSVDWRFTVAPVPLTDRRGSHQDHEVCGRTSTHNDEPAAWLSRGRGGDEEHDGRDGHDEGSPSFAYDQYCSPTFSAATISSSGGGLNTPFRLSTGFPHTSADASLDHVTDRLRQLGSEDSAGSLASQVASAISETEADDERACIPRYALPQLGIGTGMAMESATTLSKVSSQEHASVRDDDSALLLQPTYKDEDIGSFADTIFSELGYLSGSIA